MRNCSGCGDVHKRQDWYCKGCRRRYMRDYMRFYRADEKDKEFREYLVRLETFDRDKALTSKELLEWNEKRV